MSASTRTPADPALRAPIRDRPDEELLLRLRGGEDAAYGELYRRYEPEVRRFARSLVATDEVDDVVAETFARVLSVIANGRGPVDHPERYLMVATRTTAITLRRRHARQIETATRAAHDRSTGSQQEVIDDAALINAFRSLHPRARQVLWATIVEQRDQAEVGAELGLSRNAVAALAYRQRNILRAAYAEQRRTLSR
ncbi:MAG: RNA polymerase sigma factor [Aquihabitans sp.]